MNQDDKQALSAFKSMFGALSSSVRKKYEGKSRGNTRSHPHSSTKDHPKLLLALVENPKPGESFVQLVPAIPSNPLLSAPGRTDPLSDEGFVRSET